MTTLELKYIKRLAKISSDEYSTHIFNMGGLSAVISEINKLTEVNS